MQSTSSRLLHNRRGELALLLVAPPRIPRYLSQLSRRQVSGAQRFLPFLGVFFRVGRTDKCCLCVLGGGARHVGSVALDAFIFAFTKKKLEIGALLEATDIVGTVYTMLNTK
jgi:hypothetical protein